MSQVQGAIDSLTIFHISYAGHYEQFYKRMKVEIARELGEKAAVEKTIKRTFFCKLRDSKYCMKGDPKVVGQTLKKLKSDSAKRDALKNNIYTHTKGFGWVKFHITMIHNCHIRSRTMSLTTFLLC